MTTPTKAAVRTPGDEAREAPDLAEMREWAAGRLASCKSIDQFHVNVGRYADLIALLKELQQRRSSPASKDNVMSEEQIKHMVDRFLGWKLPKDFRPDDGITFNPEYNVEYNAKRGLPPARREPSGTNLFDATQATAMVRFMVEGMPGTPASSEGDWQPTAEGTRDGNRIFKDGRWQDISANRPSGTRGVEESKDRDHIAAPPSSSDTGTQKETPNG